MRDLDYSKSVLLAEWVEKECRHLDLIASWEELLNIYTTLSFIDPINDEIRLKEFKDVIAEINKFLTRMKTGLDNTRDLESAIEFLKKHADTKEVNKITTRTSLTYNKMRQLWVMSGIRHLQYQLDILSEGEEDDE